MKYICLLRGINVGGKNKIKMQDLKSCFEEMGFTEVQTYIQSGNVVFEADKTDPAKLTSQIERELESTFKLELAVVVISANQLQQVIDEAPKGFGSDQAKFRYDVLFVKPPMTAKEVLPEVSIKEGVDTVDIGEHALYFSRLIAKATQSHQSRIVGKPVYKSLTIRNWNTTTKLQEMASN